MSAAAQLKEARENARLTHEQAAALVSRTAGRGETWLCERPGVLERMAPELFSWTRMDPMFGRDHYMLYRDVDSLERLARSAMRFDYGPVVDLSDHSSREFVYWLERLESIGALKALERLTDEVRRVGPIRGVGSQHDMHLDAAARLRAALADREDRAWSSALIELFADRGIAGLDRLEDRGLYT